MADERNRDIVLAPNEFIYVMDETKAQIGVYCNTKFSLSNSDRIVIYDKNTNKFKEAPLSQAIQTFVSCPANWYVELTNPTVDGKHPTPGTSNALPELRIEKVNLPGPQNFALYPGQTAKIIQGHKLRLNEYLIVKVYNDDKLDKNKYPYKTGKNIIIKGTDQEFYMPVTGLEVIPDENGNYNRKAVTLQDLEYCILVSENGNKRYVKGPAVTFPEIDEHFIINEETGTPIFRAIELSDISGIYVKVIADYDEEITEPTNYEEIDEVVEVDGEISEEIFEDEEDIKTKVIHHKAGEELFITGKDTQIYYPCPEHSIISYEGKILHHATAIPAGEGRYVLNRLTSEIRLERGPKMLLLDPRVDVFVHRKLTKKECELWYPGNKDVLKHNEIDLPVVEIDKDAFRLYNGKTLTTSSCCLDSLSSSASTTYSADALNNGFLGQENVGTYKNAGINRGNTYTKPRTITLDNKYEVVTIDIWSGFAVNVVSKDGRRRTEIGPKTIMLEYDETLEVIENTVFLRIDNDRVFDNLIAETKDFVKVNIKLSYLLNFDRTQKDKWFSIENYKNYISDYERSEIKKEAKNYTIEEFYNNASDIINKTVLKEDSKTKKPAVFANGMYISDVEVLDAEITDNNVKNIFDKHQEEIIAKTLELSAANKEINVTKELEKIEKEKFDLHYQNEMYKLDLNNKMKKEQETKQAEFEKLVEIRHKAEREHEKELQTLKAAIEKIELAAAKEKRTQELDLIKEQNKLEIDREKARTDALKKVIDSISPDLISSLESASQFENLREIAQSLSPYALASGSESVADTVNKLLRGTSLEGLIDKVVDAKKE